MGDRNVAKDESIPNVEVLDFENSKVGLQGDRVPVLKTYKLFIGGEFPRTESGRVYPLKLSQGGTQPDGGVANICLGSRKDIRNAVVCSRGAFGSWAAKSAYNRGQITYRIAEVMETRRSELVQELIREGSTRKDAERECNAAIDRVIHFAGWADKYQQILSSVNPVASSHFSFSVLEPMGVVGILAPEAPSLLGLLSLILPAIVGGNTTVVVPSFARPLTAVCLSEVLATSDLPGGVVNIITGKREELSPTLVEHMDVNAIVISEGSAGERTELERAASGNLKRVIRNDQSNWFADDVESPYSIGELQEIKTVWHPIGN